MYHYVGLNLSFAKVEHIVRNGLKTAIYPLLLVQLLLDSDSVAPSLDAHWTVLFTKMTTMILILSITIGAKPSF